VYSLYVYVHVSDIFLTARHFVKRVRCLLFACSMPCGLSLLPTFRDVPFNESGTHSCEVRSHIGRQSVGRTLRGLLLLRRSLPFKPPPILTLPSFLHPASSCPSPFRPALAQDFSLSILLFPLHPWETGSHFPLSLFASLTDGWVLAAVFSSAFLDETRWRNLGDQIRRGWNPRVDFRDFHSGFVSRARTTYPLDRCYFGETMAEVKAESVPTERWKTDRTRNGRPRESRHLPWKCSNVKLTLDEFQSIIERKRKGIGREGNMLVRETLVFNEMCVERVWKLRDPFKFNVTTKLEHV